MSSTEPQEPAPAKTCKHVIFLGAGASKKSGYPLANELRLMISSRQKWKQKLSDYQSHWIQNNKISVDFLALGLEFWDKHVQSLDLFRNGGFATLDEFCKLAGGHGFEQEIHELRNVVRAALGLVNPEEQFENSEYYGFVQALFKSDLRSLRDDVSVLTYNYDPYLDFLLYRALNSRWHVTRKGRPFAAGADVTQMAEEQKQLNEVTSGFYMPQNPNWLNANFESFCLLKLHGSIAFGVAPKGIDFETLFLNEPQQRAEKLFHIHAQGLSAPVLFPWEIINEKGLVEKAPFASEYSGVLYPLFSGIWKRARREVQSAKKISFVGLSMHQFLEDGLKYLFDGKTNETQIVSANPDNAPFMSGRSETHWGRFPYSPAYALSQTLNRVAPKMKRVGIVTGHSGASNGEITLVKDFADFVKTEMTPIKIAP